MHIDHGAVQARFLGSKSQEVAFQRIAGGGEGRLVAYLVADDVAVTALRNHLGETLPDYMVPSAFVWLDAIPLTTSGKVIRRGFREKAAREAGAVTGDGVA